MINIAVIGANGLLLGHYDSSNDVGYIMQRFPFNIPRCMGIPKGHFKRNRDKIRKQCIEATAVIIRETFKSNEIIIAKNGFDEILDILDDSVKERIIHVMNVPYDGNDGFNNAIDYIKLI